MTLEHVTSTLKLIPDPMDEDDDSINVELL